MNRKWVLFKVIGLLTLWLSTQMSAGAEAQTISGLTIQNMQVLGQIGGVSRAVFVKEDIAYLGVGPRVLILNVTDPTQPTFMGQTPILPSLVNDISVRGNYIYIAAGKDNPRSLGYDVGEDPGGMYIFDISNPAVPVEVGNFSTTSTVFSLNIVGSIAYIAVRDSGLRLIDISDPTLPAEISLFSVGWSVQNIAISGSTAYIANDQVLRLVDVSNPALPVELGTIPSLAWDVDIVGQFAYVTGRSGGIRIIDVANPDAPIELTHHGASYGSSIGVVIKENIAYVIGEDGRLHLFNVSDPASPTDLGMYDMGGSFEDITVVENIAYLADGGGGLRLIDVSDPSAPVEVGMFDTLGSAEQIAVNGNIAYVTDGGSFPGFVEGGGGIRIIDVSDPINVVEMGYLETSYMAMDIEVVENIAYVADWGVDLRLIDVSDPTNLVQISSFDNVNHLANDLTVVNSIVFIADGGGLRLVDVSNPQALLEIGYYESPSYGGPQNVSVARNIVYFLDRLGLYLLDVSNPDDIKEYGFYATTYLGQVAASEDVFYVFEDSGTIHILDFLDPISPLEIGFVETPSYSHINDVAFVGDTAYIADGSNGLHVINLVGQVATEIANYDSMGFASSVAVVNDIVFVSDGEGGLIILQQTSDNISVPRDEFSITPPVENLPSHVSPTTPTNAQLTDRSSEVFIPAQDLINSDSEVVSSPTNTHMSIQVANWIPLTLGLVGLITIGGVLVWRRWSRVSTALSSSKTCPHCGIINPLFGHFCKQCGHELKKASR